MKAAHFLLITLIPLALMCCSRSPNGQQDKNIPRAQMQTRAEEPEAAKEINGIYLVAANYIMAYVMTDYGLNENKRLTASSCDLELYDYALYIESSQKKLKDQLGLDAYDAIMPRPCKDRRRLELTCNTTGWFKRPDFMISNTIVMIEGPNRKRIRLYLTKNVYPHPELIITPSLLPNREISYLSLKDNQIVLTNGWKGSIEPCPAQFLGNLDVTAIVVKRMPTIEFGERIIKEVKHYEAAIVEINAKQIDYICNSHEGLAELAEDLEKTIVQTEYPFLFRMIPK